MMRLGTVWIRGKRGLAAALRWSLLALPFSLIWEWAQVPLYTLAEDGAGDIVFAIVHCTLGDAAIAFSGYLIAALLCRASDWPIRAPSAGTMSLILFSVTFTVWSEWYNVYRANNWDYAGAMPTVLGIGLSPLLQWTIVPVAMLAIWRWRLH